MNLISTSGVGTLPHESLELTEARPSQLVADLNALFKPRITVMVLLTVAIGFICGSTGEIQWLLLLNSLLGIGSVAAASGILNQCLERDTDALMKRTRNRPLPTGSLSAEAGWTLGLALTVFGLTYLLVSVNSLTAALTAVTIAIYVLLYTPLKRLTPWNTLIGAIPGALPPVLGYAAAAGTVDIAAWSLFGILFLWQFPHFWAIAWLHREDYARAGLVMLPAVDGEEGRMTGRMMFKSCLLLVLVSLLPAVLRFVGMIYFGSALLLGGFFLAACIAFWMRPTDRAARLALWASLIYLPLVLIVLLLDGPLRG